MVRNEFGQEQVDQCLVCRTTERKELFIGRDDRYGLSDHYPVVECMKCGLAYLATRPSESKLSELYGRFYPSTVTPSGKRGGKNFLRYKASLKNTPLWRMYQSVATPTNLYTKIHNIKGKSVLDVGSGLSRTAAAWVTRNGGRWTSLEANEHVNAYLNRLGLSCHTQSIEQFSQSTCEQFDYIVMSQVLEHAYYPYEFLKAGVSLLKENGRILVSCPNYDSIFRLRFGTQWAQWHIPYHVSQFGRKSLQALLSQVGLDLAEWSTVTPSGWFRVQRAKVKEVCFADTSTKSQIMLQLYLNARFQRVNAEGCGDAFVAVLKCF